MDPQGPVKDISQKERFWSGIEPGRIFALAAVKICLIYLVFGILWIVFSDWILFLLAPHLTEYAMIETVKGVLFVFVTAFLLFLLIRHFTCQLRQKNEELQTANNHLSAREDELRVQCGALALSHAEWESTFNAISDWISLISPDGRILKTNRSVESLLGVPPDQVTGRNCFELLHGTVCPVTGCPRLRMLASRKRESIEIPKRQGDGWLLVTVDPIVNSAGEVVSAVHIVRDITGRMQEQKALEQAKKKLHLLNYVTFNEIQNAVFTLWGFQQFVKEKAIETPVRLAIKKEEELLSKISQSLKFAQAFQSLGLKSPSWQDARQVFLMAISHLDFLKLKHTVQLDGLEIFADPLLEQVLQILADNTLIHGKTATQVILRYTEGLDSVTIFYEDNGVGIPEKIKEEIFSPDFQKTKSIGLFLAQEILEITGISIRETGIPGKGVRFEIIVPRGAYRFPGRK